MPVLTPGDVEYLAFEGGGGKGVTYLGAIEALEHKYHVLPIERVPDPTKAGEYINAKQVVGLAGSSAGAITSLYLALGFDSKRLKNVLAKGKKFSAFFDDPAPTRYRAINEKGEPEVRTNSGLTDQAEINDTVKKRLNSLDRKLYEGLFLGASSLLGPQTALASIVLVGLLEYKLHGFFKEHNEIPIVAKISEGIDQYLYNLLFDGGLFPGFTVRQHFQQEIWQGLSYLRFLETGSARMTEEETEAWSNINFRDFRKLTGVEMFVTGANITNQKMLYFSPRHTPDFPVAEAVAISMNLPFLFKPIVSDYEPPKSEWVQQPVDYKGLWVDGGLLNNLPIHAFDKDESNPKVSSDPDLRPLHPNVLGLRLTDGWPTPEPILACYPKEPEIVTGQVLTGLLGTLTSPSEVGQLRTPSEIEQTVDLYTALLETTEFALPESQSREPIRAAFNAVVNYFSQASMGSAVP